MIYFIGVSQEGARLAFQVGTRGFHIKSKGKFGFMVGCEFPGQPRYLQYQAWSEFIRDVHLVKECLSNVLALSRSLK